MQWKPLKRTFDLIVASIILLVTFPVSLLVGITLSITNQGTPFFTQHRPGLHGRIFRIIKFKTMSDKKDSNGKLLPDSVRLTPIGSFVRKTSLDEIPQLLNVIKGDMSLIGPRPLLVEYLPLYTDEQARRHEVRPGITGWAQVNGRNAISWDEKFRLDVWYVDNISFGIDLRILLLTVFKVLKSDGVAQEGQATVEYFNGTN